jgi:hypothetical protein
MDREAEKATIHGHGNRPRLLNSLSLSLSSRYALIGKFEDLEEAIRNVQEALNATPSAHPDRAI